MVESQCPGLEKIRGATDLSGNAEEAAFGIEIRALVSVIEFDGIFGNDLVIHLDRAGALLGAAGQGKETADKNQSKQYLFHDSVI